MAATPLYVGATAEEIVEAKGKGERDYDFNDIAVPGDYRGTVVGVQDHTSKAGNTGWKFEIEVLGCPFDEYVMHSQKARWKLFQMAEALGHDVSQGIETFDPNIYIGSEIGVSIDWQTDPDLLDEGEANYREITSVFPVSEFESADVPAAL